MTQNERWELGGEFHWAGMSPGPFLPWPTPSVWFSLGRHAILRLLDLLGGNRTLWLPGYFCSEVVLAWHASASIRFYEDSPGIAHPRWETLTPEPHDLVMAVNYFGMRNGSVWSDWSSDHPCVLIEDHSHDSHSNWARTSRADYAFSAVRKVMPVPDGAILWSPAGLALPTPAKRESTGASETKLAAMLFKSEYLALHGTNELKRLFRRLQVSAETSLERIPVSAASSFTMEYLTPGAPLSWRAQRRENSRYLLYGLQNWAAAQPIYKSVNDEDAPLGVPFLFTSASSRNDYREFLRTNQIYCPIHWVLSDGANETDLDFSARMITIPSDHRYTADDMQRVVDVIARFSK
jgi:hypothetical protein